MDRKVVDSRREDLEFISARMSEITREHATINADMGNLRRRTNQELQEVLRAAGIFERFAQIESRRDQGIAKMTQGLEALNAEMTKLNGTKAFLQERGKVPTDSGIEPSDGGTQGNGAKKLRSRCSAWLD